ncbi:DUF1445-domain-containing protein [Xylona heveae TC161]|uniref:DUF1445-domain-containing protein n=1 Tax=Xylona heveae (strain CBS 132557 / TC161) TaxID=1328760 RepID=A0A164ZU15_XYLHT|nr:DUF1445-domain-containing protein [Xylona heveae TC161]KZF19516.1 DUF1445-domain-containing protein [Xylona heveae TC161]
MAPSRVVESGQDATGVSVNEKQQKQQQLTPAQATRLLARRNKITSTAGLAPGYLQANLLVLPGEYASHFADLCARNPVPCPILGITPRGDPHQIIPGDCIREVDSLTEAGDEELLKLAKTSPNGVPSGSDSTETTEETSTVPGFDIRTDIPSYKVFHGGKHVSTQRDILSEWGPSHVGFLIGCSYSFEDGLLAAGFSLRHHEQGTIVPMYKTNIPVLPAGVFHGSKFIVSMRPFRAEDVEKVREVTRPYLPTHGEPVAWGWEGAKEIGIRDVDSPDFGDRAEMKEGEVPVFWGCGVTPQMIVEAAGSRVEGVVMSHDPGHMLITDLTVEDLARLRK